MTITGGDAEAAVSAVANLARLNRYPPQWDRLAENTATHPSNSRRIQAIMDQYEMDPEELPAILDKLNQDEERYPLPADVSREEGLLSAEFKARRASVAQWWLLGLVLLLPPLLARGVVALGWHGAMAWAACAGGILFCLLLRATVLGYTAVGGERRLRGRLVDRWKRERLDLAAWQTAFVALAPARALRIYEGRFEWDMGLLVFTNDRLCYLGCKTRFALLRSQISAIRLGPGVPRLGKSSRVYLTWCEDEGMETTWNLRPAGVISRRALEREMPHLFHALQEWHEKPPLTEPLPVQLSSLQAPAIGTTTSTTIAAFLRASPLGRSLSLLALLSGGLAFLFGCPFGVGSAPGWGWYAPALTCLMMVFVRVPFWLYREPRPLKASARALADRERLFEPRSSRQ